MNMAIDPAAAAKALELASIVWPSRPRPEGASAPAAWHIVHCVGSSDQRALDWLNRLQMPAYYPHLRELRPVPRDKLSKKQRALGVTVMRPKIIPLLPRYIFVRFDLGRLAWREEFALAGIVGLLSADGGRSGQVPIKVSDEVIAEIRAREVDGAVPGSTPLWELLSIGDRVRIAAGPFANHVGNVEAIRQQASDQFDSGTRIRIAIALFGRMTIVELEADQIEKVGRAD